MYEVNALVGDVLLQDIEVVAKVELVEGVSSDTGVVPWRAADLG